MSISLRAHPNAMTGTRNLWCHLVVTIENLLHFIFYQGRFLKDYKDLDDGERFTWCEQR